jgi:hypothetical protein
LPGDYRIQVHIIEAKDVIGGNKLSVNNPFEGE